MAMSVTYSNFGGEIILENRLAVQSRYLTDPLGDTVALVNTSHVETDTWQYWPFLETAFRIGTTQTPIAFCGSLGVFQPTYADPG